MTSATASTAGYGGRGEPEAGNIYIYIEYGILYITILFCYTMFALFTQKFAL